MAIVGALIGAGGLVVAVLRLIDGRKSAILNEKVAEEAKRANDLNEEKWRYQRAKNENDQKTEASSKAKTKAKKV